MRLVFVIVVAFCALAGGGLDLRADEIPGAPGWGLNKFTENNGGEDGTYSDGRVFYALKPPDSRPAVTIDTRTADRLRAGEMSPESAYAGQSSPPKQKEDDEFVYGNHGNGIAMADPVSSTLTAEEGRKDQPPAAANASSSITGVKSAGGIQGFNSSGGISGPGADVSRSLSSARNNSAASSAPPSAAAGIPGAAAAAGGGAPSIQDPRAAAAAENQAFWATATGTGSSTSTATSNGHPGFALNNGAQGFGMSVSTSSSSNSNTQFSIWPNGDPATMTRTNTDTSNSTAIGFNQSTRPLGPGGQYCNDAVVPVEFTLTSYQDCMNQLGSGLKGAEGDPLLPDDLSLDGYCRRQFPSFNDGTAQYAVHARLYVDFAFSSYDSCYADLTQKLPAMSAWAKPPGRGAEDNVTSAAGYCRDQFPSPAAAQNPPPVVTDDTGAIVSGPAVCSSLDSSHVYACVTADMAAKKDPGVFLGYHNSSRTLTQKNCQDWCTGYGIKGACVFTQARAPCSQSVCKFIPADVCTSHSGYQLVPMTTPQSADDVPQDTTGSTCQ